MIYGNPMKFRQTRLDNLLKVNEKDVASAVKRLSEACEKSCTGAVFCNKSDDFAGNIIKIPL